MSETLGSATLELKTDDTDLDRGLAKAGRGAERLDAKFQLTSRNMVASMNRAGEAMRRMGKSTVAAGKKVTTRLTAPILAIGVGILKAAADFEKGMNQVRALTGATGADFKKLEDQAKLLGATTQFSAGQAADAMGFLAQAGFDADQIFAALPATLNLAAAANLDLGQTADIVSNIMTGYGLETEEAGRATDVLTAAFISSNTNLAQLGEAMKFVGPVASGFGIQFEEAAAAIGLMGNAGMQGAMAGTACRGALTRLAKPSNEAGELMANLGINVTKTDGSMVSLVEIVRQLEASGANASEMMTIFGQRAGPAMLALVKQGSGALVDFTEKLEESGGTAERIGKVQMEGLSGSLKALKSSLEAVAIAIADTGLLEWVTDMATGLAGWFREMAKTNPEILKWGVIIAGVTAAIGPLLIALGLAVTAIGLLLSPIGLVVAAIMGTGALVAALVLLGKTANDISDKTIPELRTEISKLEEKIRNQPGLADLWSQKLAEAEGKLRALERAVESSNEGMEGYALKVQLAADTGDRFSRSTDAVTTGVKDVATAVKSSAKEIAASAKEIAASIQGMAVDVDQWSFFAAERLRTNMRDGATEAAASIQGMAVDIDQWAFFAAESMRTNLRNGTTAVKASIQEMAADVDQWTFFAAEQMRTNMRNGTEAVSGEIVPEMVGMVENWFKRMSGVMVDRTQEGAAGVRMTLEEAAQIMGSFFSGMAAALKTFGGKYWKWFKAFAIAEAITNTFVAVTKALSAYPYPWNLAPAAGAALHGFARVRQIQQMQPPPPPVAHTGKLFGTNSLAPFPGSRPNEGLAILREGERVITQEQGNPRRVIIQMPKGDMMFSTNQVRSLLVQLERTLQDDSARLLLQVV